MPDYEELASSMLDELRLALRVSSNAFDDEILMLAQSALMDMTRVGICDSYVSEMGARVRNAVTCYVKAGFGYDNPDYRNLDQSYRQIVIDMANSYENNAYRELL